MFCTTNPYSFFYRFLSIQTWLGVGNRKTGFQGVFVWAPSKENNSYTFVKSSQTYPVVGSLYQHLLVLHFLFFCCTHMNSCFSGVSCECHDKKLGLSSVLIEPVGGWPSGWRLSKVCLCCSLGPGVSTMKLSGIPCQSQVQIGHSSEGTLLQPVVDAQWSPTIHPLSSEVKC